MSKVSAYYHIVFCTKGRRMTLPLEHCEHLYRFIWKELTELNCRLLRIGGIQNHVHMLIDLHPSVALSNLMRDVKRRSSAWMHSDLRFSLFEEWAAEYFATTISPSDKDTVIEYIKNQHLHHLGKPFEDEISDLCLSAYMSYDDERDFR